MSKSISPLHLIYVVLILTITSGYSQQNHDIRFYFQTDTVSIESNKTFSNQIIIENHSDGEVWLTPQAPNSFTLNGLITLPDSIFLTAFQTKSFPLKYLADRRIIQRKTQAFSLSFSTPHPQINIQPETSFYTYLPENNHFLLRTSQKEYYLDPTHNQVQIQIHCTNIGLIPVSFQILISENSKLLEINGENQWITLDAGMQTVVPYTIHKTSNLNIDHMIRVRAEREDGSLLSQKQVKILTAGSSKSYHPSLDHLSPFSLPAHKAELRYVSMNQNYSILQFLSDGQIHFSDQNNLQYRIHMDYYSESSAVNIYNSFLQYNTSTWGVKAGNIYDNLDHHIGGRGLQATYRLNENQTINIYGVENEYLLFSPTGKTPRDKIYAGSFSFSQTPYKENQISILYRQDPFREINSAQVHSKIFLTPESGGEWTLEGGSSIESSGLLRGKYGFSAGASYHRSMGAYRFVTQNYFSSPYYTGMRRGLTQSDTRLIRTFSERHSASARISIINNQPKYQDTDIGFRYHRNDRIDIYELGYQVFSRLFSLHIKPYYIQQHLERERDFTSPETIRWDSRSIRTQIYFNFFKNQHRFSWNTDYGYTYRSSAENPKTPFHSLRAFGQYNYRFWGVHSYLQINPYHLTDMLAVKDSGSYRQFSIGPNLHLKAMEKRLSFQLSAFYNNHSTSHTHNYSLNGNAFWMFSPEWKLKADLYYSMARFSGFSAEEPLIPDPYDYVQFKVGLEKNFHQTAGRSGHKLQLTLFKDHNNNGIQDEDEPLVEGAMVKIDQLLATTNHNGRVRFSGLPSGSYQLHIIHRQGWALSRDYKITISKNQSLKIPLIKTQIIRGQVRFHINMYENSTPSLSGIRIHATPLQGNDVTTYTDQDGRFTFYLPPGQYTFWPNTEHRPFTSLQESYQMIVNGDESETKELLFDLKDNRRKVRIKRF